MKGEASKDARVGARADKKPEKGGQKPVMTTRAEGEERRTPLEKKKRMIIERMQKLGIYKAQYMAAINRTAELYLELDALMKRYEAEGREAVVEHTNKAGATNFAKNPIRGAIDDVYSQLLAHERELGLTPLSLRKLNESAAQSKHESPLVKALKEMKTG